MKNWAPKSSKMAAKIEQLVWQESTLARSFRSPRKNSNQWLLTSVLKKLVQNRTQLFRYNHIPYLSSLLRPKMSNTASKAIVSSKTVTIAEVQLRRPRSEGAGTRQTSSKMKIKGRTSKRWKWRIPLLLLPSNNPRWRLSLRSSFWRMISTRLWRTRMKMTPRIIFLIKKATKIY